MPEIIQQWLGTRLGVLLDMSPQKFGRNTKDGTILAKVLYNYGVIPVHVFDKIKESKNYHECYKNLTVLKPWLDHIGVTHDDSILQSMAGGEGSAAISIFYAVYLNLERKNRLYYLSAQKERKFSEDSCRNRFKVDWVPEREVKSSSQEDTSKLAMPLFEKRDLIECHRAKCREVTEMLRKTKENFEKIVGQKPDQQRPAVSKFTKSQALERLCEAEETRKKIKAFEAKHHQECPDLTYSELIELKNAQETQPCFPTPNLAEAKNIISNIKRRKKSEVYARNFQVKMQHMVLDEYWKQITDKQDKDFEDAVCENLLKQSQYEKQMASKLYMIRNQKKVLVENRRKIECLKIEQRDKEFDDLVVEKMEARGEDWEYEEFERERIAELHRRLYDEKVRRRRRLIAEESQRIYEDLVDIAIRMSEIRQLTGSHVPKTLMKDLKELFYKGLSIFDLLDNLEEIYEPDVEESGEELGIIYSNEEYDRLKTEETERQAVLNECDLNDYLILLGPWMVELFFPDGTETEVKHVILGYIVHKLLSAKYPPPKAPVPAAIKPMQPTAVVLGLTEETACRMLVDLMEACRVLVVRVDDAINFVLAAYKQELSVVRDIDINFQKATSSALKTKSVEKEKEVRKKAQLLKKSATPKTEMVVKEDVNELDKQTQTPRMIPEDDPILSPNAEVGKLAFEALGSGDPVPDRVIVSAVVAYVISKQEDYNGWVLLNYPLLYSQASDLECALTGYRVLPVLDEMETLEDVEGFRYRESCVELHPNDSLSIHRVSRLVPQPFTQPITPLTSKTYFDCFIRVKKVTDSSRSPLDKFYSDQDILFNYDFVSLNFQSVKNIGKMILSTQHGESNPDLVPRTSVEIFGSVVLELNEKWEPAKKKNVKESAGRKVMKEVDLEPVEVEETLDMKERSIEKKPEAQLAKPGDPEWKWAAGEMPESIQKALASLWENMEAVYTEDLKNVFFCLRVHRSNVLSYSAFIRKSARTFMKRPDEKQNVLDDFQQMFNDVDVDLRPDVDIKNELHVRVSELEEALMGMADERKKNSLKDLKKLAQDGWVSDEMANLVNIYLAALQLEADRCIDTCQVIMDYYTTLQQKIPDDKPLGKIMISKLQITDRKYSIVSSNKSNTSAGDKRVSKSLLELGSKSHLDKTKTRSLTERRKRSSEVSFLTGAREVITDILINLTLPDDGLTPFHNFYIDTVQLATNEVRNVLEGCISEAKKGEKGGKNTKKASDPKIPNGNLIAEWGTSLDNELSRFLFRMKLILARGIFEMNEFLTTILNVLSALTEDITDMYLREIQSISECCKVFRCGIEEEIGIQPRLELRVDEFVVNADILLFPNEEEEKILVVAEDDQKKYRFTIEQLSLLFQKLQRVAPDGEIIKRSLVFILQDLRALKPVETGYCFPEIWSKIEPNDLTYIIDRVYQDLEIVHWKDFIIYGMDLPVPTEDQILWLRKSYREFDPLVTELISRENYDSVRFWFETTLDHYPKVDRNEKAKDLLYRMYQVDEHQTNYSALLLAFCKDDNPIFGFTKALALAVGKRIIVREFSDEFTSVEGEGERSYEMYESSRSKESYSTVEVRKCIPKDKIVRCECQDRKSTTEDSDSFENLSETGEGSVFYVSKSSQASETSSVTFSVLSSLLKASYPSLPQLSILLDCQQTFQQTVDSILDDLECHDDTVEVGKLIHHKFIYSLLQSTNKFKCVKIKDILTTIIRFRTSTAQTACLPDKLNVNSCLN